MAKQKMGITGVKPVAMNDITVVSVVLKHACWRDAHTPSEMGTPIGK